MDKDHLNETDMPHHISGWPQAVIWVDSTFIGNLIWGGSTSSLLIGNHKHGDQAVADDKWALLATFIGAEYILEHYNSNIISLLSVSDTNQLFVAIMSFGQREITRYY